MKTSALLTLFLLIAASQLCFAQLKSEALAMSETTEPPVTKPYSGAHGPFYNGTINDPTIPPRSAVPVGSLKGIKRNFTNKVIEGEAGKNQQLMIGDDMQTTPKGKSSSKKKAKYQQTVW